MAKFERDQITLLRLTDYRRFTNLVQRREALAELTAMIERHADAAHAARRAERQARRDDRRARRDAGRGPHRTP